MSTETETPIELSGAQVAKMVGFPAQKLATYVSNPDRWLSFFPDQGATGPGRYRYYRLGDVPVIAMLIDTSSYSQTLAVEFRRLLANEIRIAIASGSRPEWVHATVDRMTVSYQPRWELLDFNLDQLFD